MRARQALNETQGVELHICVAAALRRGVADTTEAARLGLAGSNLPFCVNGDRPQQRAAICRRC